MTTNVEIVTRNYELFGTGDIAALIDTYADDGVLVHHGPEAAPTRGEYRKSQIMEYFAEVGKAIDIERFQIGKLLADGDTVVALVDIAFTARNSGKRYEGPAVHVTTLRNGLNLRHEIFGSEPASVYVV